VNKVLAIVLGLASGLLVGAFTPLSALPPGSGNAPTSTLAHANAALQSGQADKALSLLQQLPQGGAQDPQARNLACRVEYTLADWDAAIHDCQNAIRLDPQNSDNHLWLGRALGEKASRASFISAYSLAKKVLAEFQQAAQLDPNNGEAFSDLGEFYQEAPGVVGGGLDKAENVADHLDTVDPVRANELRAGIAGQRGDYAQAESWLRKALAVSPHPAYQWAALARFYAERGRWDEMDNAIHNCEAAAARDPRAAVALYDAAGVLIKFKREPELAAKLLQLYLASPDKTEQAPAFVAYARLASLQQKLGDQANAQVALTAASELAHEYRPVQDLRR
jgi:tetratricopeptide (TPR) repeat protein